MDSRSTILVTGGAGFIGSAVVRRLIATTPATVVNVDKLTYAGNLESLTAVAGDPRYRFERADICDGPALRRVFDEHQPTAVLHLAAESHVDRSIDGPAEFIETNVVGTFRLLEEAGATGPRWKARRATTSASCTSPPTRCSARSGPRAASPRPRPTRPTRHTPPARPHPIISCVRGTTRSVCPVVTTNCSNNYGPCQFPEKLIPLAILNAVGGKPMPVYGRGDNVRDWLFVDDHAAALLTVLEHGTPGETYIVGGDNQRPNLEVVHMICDLVDELRSRHRAPRDAT